MWNRFTKTSKKLIRKAHDLAKSSGHSSVGSLHLLAAMLEIRESTAVRILRIMEVPIDDLHATLMKEIGEGDHDEGTLDFAEDSKRVLEMAWNEAGHLGSHLVGSGHLLLGILINEGLRAFGLLKNTGVTYGTAKKAAVALMASQPHRSDIRPGKVQAEQSDFRTQAFRGPSMEILEAAFKEVYGRGDRFITPEDLLLGLLKVEGTGAWEYLKERGLDFDSAKDDLTDNPEEGREENETD